MRALGGALVMVAALTCCECGARRASEDSGMPLDEGGAGGAGGWSTGSDALQDVAICFAPEDVVLIPTGEFPMGCDEAVPACGPDEGPVRHVFVSAFEIDIREVSNREYNACEAAGWCRGRKYKPRNLPDEKPVNYVTWEEAARFCSWRCMRLPTEAEWEKAARGADGRTYPWGNTEPTCKRATYFGCGGELTPVGTREGASPYGVKDMAGNVGEWVSDVFAPYDFRETMDPVGPSGVGLRILRGGSVESQPSDIRTSSRRRKDADSGDLDTGIRCVRKAG